MGRRLLHASGLLSFTNNEEREGVLLLLRKRIWALGALFFLPVRGDRDNEDDRRENRRVCTRCVRAARNGRVCCSTHSVTNVRTQLDGERIGTRGNNRRMILPRNGAEWDPQGESERWEISVSGATRETEARKGAVSGIRMSSDAHTVITRPLSHQNLFGHSCSSTQSSGTEISAEL